MAGPVGNNPAPPQTTAAGPDPTKVASENDGTASQAHVEQPASAGNAAADGGWLAPEGPTFGNLLYHDRPSTPNRSELVFEDGHWYEITSDKRRLVASGKYAFAIQNGRVWAVNIKDAGHIDAARGLRGTMLGEVSFTWGGKLKSWTNGSGHYVPSGFFAKNAADILPIEKFKGMESVKGGQLPVFQPPKGSVFVPPLVAPSPPPGPALFSPARAAEGPTFGDLSNNKAERELTSQLLPAENGEWKEVVVLGTGGRPFIRKPSGRYIFVIQGGKIWAARTTLFHKDFKLVERGQRVTYAGTMKFTGSGQLEEWTNKSDGIRPSSVFAESNGREGASILIYVGLPMKKFKEADYTGKKGPQLPFIQPAEDPQGDFYNKLAAGDRGPDQTGSSGPPSSGSNSPAIRPTPSGTFASASESAGDGQGTVKPLGIDLSRYPADGEGAVLRFLRERPVLGQLGSVVTGAAAAIAAAGMMDKAQAHIESSVDQAHSEFVSKFPDTRTIVSDADLDGLRHRYEEALAKVRTPENARIFGQIVTVALTPDKDVEAASREMETRLKKLHAKPQDVESFLKAAHAYEDAMCDVQQKLSEYSQPLPAIAANVSQRAVGLQDVGKDTKRTFFSLVQSVLGLPVAETQLWPVYSAGRALEDIGNRMNAFAGEINERTVSYQRLHEELDKRLTNVGTQINTLQQEVIGDS
jgi:hypothetical protein